VREPQSWVCVDAKLVVIHVVRRSVGSGLRGEAHVNKEHKVDHCAVDETAISSTSSVTQCAVRAHGCGLYGRGLWPAL
jgi:hypothetical protein